MSSQETTHQAQILGTAPLLHGTHLTYPIMLALLPGRTPKPFRAYLVCYAGPEGKLLRKGQGEDAEQAVKALWTDVLIDAGRVMERKACGERFGGVGMDIEGAGKWKWKVKSG